MSGFVDRLVGQTLGTIPSLQPRAPGLFEPAPAEPAGVFRPWIADRTPDAAPSASTALAERREAAPSGDEAEQVVARENRGQTSGIDDAPIPAGSWPAPELDGGAGPRGGLSGRDRGPGRTAPIPDLPANRLDTWRPGAGQTPSAEARLLPSRPERPDEESRQAASPHSVEDSSAAPGPRDLPQIAIDGPPAGTIPDSRAGRLDGRSSASAVPADNALTEEIRSPRPPGPKRAVVVRPASTHFGNDRPTGEHQLVLPPDRPITDRPATESPATEYPGSAQTEASKHEQTDHPVIGQPPSGISVHRPATQSTAAQSPAAQRPASEEPAAELEAADATAVTETPVAATWLAVPGEADPTGGQVRESTPPMREAGIAAQPSGRQEAAADLPRRQAPDQFNSIAATRRRRSSSASSDAAPGNELRRPEAPRRSEGEDKPSDKLIPVDPVISIAARQGGPLDQIASMSGEGSRTASSAPHITVEIGRVVITPPPIPAPPAVFPAPPTAAAPVAPAAGGIRPLSLGDYLSRRERGST